MKFSDIFGTFKGNFRIFSDKQKRQLSDVTNGQFPPSSFFFRQKFVTCQTLISHHFFRKVPAALELGAPSTLPNLTTIQIRR